MTELLSETCSYQAEQNFKNTKYILIQVLLQHLPWIPCQRVLMKGASVPAAYRGKWPFPWSYTVACKSQGENGDTKPIPSAIWCLVNDADLLTLSMFWRLTVIPNTTLTKRKPFHSQLLLIFTFLLLLSFTPRYISKLFCLHPSFYPLLSKSTKFISIYIILPEFKLSRWTRLSIFKIYICQWWSIQTQYGFNNDIFSSPTISVTYSYGPDKSKL